MLANLQIFACGPMGRMRVVDLMPSRFIEKYQQTVGGDSAAVSSMTIRQMV